MGSKKRSKHPEPDHFRIINEEQGDRREVNQQQLPREPKSGVVDDIRVLSALSFVLGGSFLSMFNSFMNHSISSNSTCVSGNIETSMLFKFYIGIATLGFMMLFGAGLICYELFRLCNKKTPNVSDQWKYFKGCCVLVFCGIIVSFAGQSISLYILHCKPILYYYIPVLVGVFFVTMATIGLLNYTLNTNR